MNNYSPELRRFLIRQRFLALASGLLNRRPAAPPSRELRPGDEDRRATSTPGLAEPDVVDLMNDRTSEWRLPPE